MRLWLAFAFASFAAWLWSAAPLGAGTGVLPDEHAPIATCESKTLPPAVEGLLKPVLLARASALRRNSHWDTAYEKAFYRLLDRKGQAAREARVALMAYYTGEHYGEELVEAVLIHPKESDGLVARYRVCRPRVSFEADLDGVVVLRTLYEIYGDIRSERSRGAVER